MSTAASAPVSRLGFAAPVMARSHFIHLIVFASGFSGLGYEMVWTRMLAVSLGHEVIAVLAVLAAFFGGLALRAFTLSDALRRTRNPHRWYALLEAIIGLWAIALVWLIPVFNELIPRWIGEESSQMLHWGVAFGTTLVLPDRSRQSHRLATVAVIIGAALAFMPPLRFIQIPVDGEVVNHRDGIMAAVAVVADASGTRYLKVNNHFTMGSTSSGFADHRQTHIPPLFHGAPRRAVFLGVGTGMSLNAAPLHPQLEVTGVEPVPEALTLLHDFGTDPEQNARIIAPRLLPSDARRFVVSTESQFDVIIADLLHPSRDGAGSLYTREHFEAVKQRLAKGDLFCQWLPLFQMDLETFKLIARTLIDRLPYVQVHIPHFSLRQSVVGLIGSVEPLAYGPDWLQTKVHSRALQRELVALRLNSNLALFGGFLADRAEFAEFAGEGQLDTDDRLLVTY